MWHTMSYIPPTPHPLWMLGSPGIGECLSTGAEGCQKNPRAHKNKNRHFPPPKPKIPPPLKRGILWTQVFLQKEGIFPGVHKIGAAISGPRIADTNFTDTRIFLRLEDVHRSWWKPKGDDRRNGTPRKNVTTSSDKCYQISWQRTTLSNTLLMRHKDPKGPPALFLVRSLIPRCFTTL